MIRAHSQNGFHGLARRQLDNVGIGDNMIHQQFPKPTTPRRVRLCATQEGMPVSLWPYMGSVGEVEGWLDDGQRCVVLFGDRRFVIAAAHLCIAE